MSNTIATRFSRRGKTFTGLTQKERHKQLHKLNGSSAFSSPTSTDKRTLVCRSCQRRKEIISDLEDEFHHLRRILLSSNRVSNLSQDDHDQQTKSTSSEQLALIQESAKLRITIDTLMRFQLFEATQTHPVFRTS